MVTIMDSFGMTESLEGALSSVVFFSRKTGSAQTLFVIDLKQNRSHIAIKVPCFPGGYVLY